MKQALYADIEQLRQVGGPDSYRRKLLDEDVGEYEGNAQE
jgi:hypothetical protein